MGWAGLGIPTWPPPRLQAGARHFDMDLCARTPRLALHQPSRAMHRARPGLPN